MNIFSQVIATGKEWKPCRGCGRVFEEGEVISSVSHDDAADAYVTYWYCYKCIDGYFGTDLYYNERGCLCSRVDWKYMTRRMNRILETEKCFNAGTQ